MFNTHYEHPATVLLSAMWALAGLLVAAALAASALAAGKAMRVAPLPHAAQSHRPAHAKGTENTTSSSMLRESRLSIGKDKLD